MTSAATNNHYRQHLERRTTQQKTTFRRSITEPQLHWSRLSHGLAGSVGFQVGYALRQRQAMGFRQGLSPTECRCCSCIFRRHHTQSTFLLPLRWRRLSECFSWALRKSQSKAFNAHRSKANPMDVCSFTHGTQSQFQRARNRGLCKSSCENFRKTASGSRYSCGWCILGPCQERND